MGVVGQAAIPLGDQAFCIFPEPHFTSQVYIFGNWVVFLYFWQLGCILYVLAFGLYYIYLEFGLYFVYLEN